MTPRCTSLVYYMKPMQFVITIDNILNGLVVGTSTIFKKIPISYNEEDEEVPWDTYRICWKFYRSIAITNNDLWVSIGY